MNWKSKRNSYCKRNKVQKKSNCLGNPVSGNPVLENPVSEDPVSEDPVLENPA